MTAMSYSSGGRSIEQIIEEQARKWAIATDDRKTKKEPPPPVITISRQPGAGSGVLAQRIAKELNLDLAGSKIIHEVAQSAHMSDKVVASLDEKERSILDNWIQLLKTTRYFWPEGYLFHLSKVVGTIGEHGGAVIIGRGANMILPSEETLRIRFVAPMEYKMQNYAKERNISEEEAKQQIITRESEQKAFVRRYFHVDIDEPLNYDYIINTQYVGADAIVNFVKSTLKYKQMPTRRKFD